MTLSLLIQYRKQTGSGLDAKILASASSIWSRLGLGLVNLASKNVLSNAKKYWIYPFCGCIIANFFLQFRYLLIRTVYAVKLSEYKDVVTHSNVGIKNQLCVVGIVDMCSYLE